MTPRGRKNDDLFNESSMSFGDHLLELRRCIIIAILCLGGGFVIALIPLGSYPSLATSAVAYVQRPLRRALQAFYQTQSTIRLESQSQTLKKFGYSDAKISSIPTKYNMAAREFWVFPNERDKLKDIPNMTIGATELGDEPSLASQEPVLVLLWEKLEDDSRTRTKALNMPETFVIFIKAAILIGILIGSPGIFYSFWSFIAAGLYPTEKRIVYRFFPVSILLFISGFCLAFFVVFELVLSFLLRFNAGMNIDPDPRISEWLNFAIMLPLGFGLAFQLPLVMFALNRVSIFKVSDYTGHWKIAVLTIAFLTMMLTPPDPWSMICMMLPLIFLYFGGIWLCVMFPPPRRPFEEQGDVVTK